MLFSFSQTEQFKGVLKEVLNNPRECKCPDHVLQGPGQSQGEEILWHYCVPVIFPFTAGVGEETGGRITHMIKVELVRERTILPQEGTAPTGTNK